MLPAGLSGSAGFSHGSQSSLLTSSVTDAPVTNNPCSHPFPTTPLERQLINTVVEGSRVDYINSISRLHKRPLRTEASTLPVIDRSEYEHIQRCLLISKRKFQIMRGIRHWQLVEYSNILRLIACFESLSTLIETMYGVGGQLADGIAIRLLAPKSAELETLFDDCVNVILRPCDCATSQVQQNAGAFHLTNCSVRLPWTIWNTLFKLRNGFAHLQFEKRLTAAALQNPEVQRTVNIETDYSFPEYEAGTGHLDYHFTIYNVVKGEVDFVAYVNNLQRLTTELQRACEEARVTASTPQEIKLALQTKLDARCRVRRRKQTTALQEARKVHESIEKDEKANDEDVEIDYTGILQSE